MIDKIKELINQIAQQQVQNTEGISNNLGSDVARETGTSIISGFKDAISNGQINDIAGLANVNSITSNPVVQNIVQSLSAKLGSNFGIDTQTAANFSQSVIPQILGSIFSKAKEGNSGFNISDIISSLSDGQGSGLLDSLKGLGLDQNGDGQVNFQDAISALGKKGGLGDILGGFFKK